MIVVDTSVWVDFLRGNDRPAVDVLVALLRADDPVVLTDAVLMELLSGAADEAGVELLDDRLSRLPILRLRYLSDFRRAAWLFRHARQQGLTVRSTVDCLIASVCIREAVPILHDDTDFDRLASVSPLVVHRAA